MIFFALGLTACISDDISSSSADLPDFSVDTLVLGDIWAEEFSPNGIVVVYNRNSSGILISEVTLSGRDAECIRVNVDGAPLERFVPVEIRANDSVIILASAVPERDALQADLNIRVNSVTRTIPIAAAVHTPLTLTDAVVKENLTLSGEVRLFGTLTVEVAATLTITPGTTIYMHDKASVTVNGTVVAEGTPSLPITVCGDRFGFVAADIPYSILPGQWKGWIINSSAGNSLSHTSMVNSADGLVLADNASLSLTNCCIANSRGTLVTLNPGATLNATGCQFTEAAEAILNLEDASATLTRCTIANSYLFGTAVTPAIILGGSSNLTAVASIIYRPGGELKASDASAFGFTDCLFGSGGSDDTGFTNCMWGVDPLFLIDLKNYSLDYRLAPESPARAHQNDADYMEADRYGTPTPPLPPLGAYN